MPSRNLLLSRVSGKLLIITWYYTVYRNCKCSLQSEHHTYLIIREGSRAQAQPAQSLLVCRLLWPCSCSQHKGNKKWPGEGWGPREQAALHSCRRWEGLCSKAVVANRCSKAHLSFPPAGWGGKEWSLCIYELELSLLPSVPPGSACCLLS